MPRVQRGNEGPTSRVLLFPFYLFMFICMIGNTCHTCTNHVCFESIHESVHLVMHFHWPLLGDMHAPFWNFQEHHAIRCVGSAC